MKNKDLENIKTQRKKGYKFDGSEGKKCEVVAIEDLGNGAIGICYLMEEV